MGRSLGTRPGVDATRVAKQIPPTNGNGRSASKQSKTTLSQTYRGKLGEQSGRLIRPSV